MGEENINPNDGGNTNDGGQNVNPTVDENTAIISDLRGQLAEANKRISGGTKSYQELKAKHDAVEAEAAKYRKYAEHIDFSELDALIGGGEPSTRTPQVSTPQGADPETANRLAQLEIKNLTTDFMAKNPDKAFVLQDPDLADKVEIAAFKEVQKERKQYGHVVSTPEEILEKAVNKAYEFHNKLIDKGKKMVTEHREKINSEGTDLGGGEKSTPASNEEEGTFDSKSYSRKRHEHNDKIRHGG